METIDIYVITAQAAEAGDDCDYTVYVGTSADNTPHTATVTVG